MKELFKITLNDFRLIFRDNSLKIFLALPFLILVFVRFAVPYIVGQYDFLNNYLREILMLASMQGPVAFGFIYAMVMVDEKDTGVAKVYGILPTSRFWFVIFRLVPAYLFALLATAILLAAQPIYQITLMSSLACSAVAAIVAPLMALSTANLARNKVEAMTWQKLWSLPLYLPIIGLYLPFALSLLLGILPTYWTYRALEASIKDLNPLPYVSIGLVYSLLLLTVLTKRLANVHFR